MPDFRYQHCGSYAILSPVTPDARCWLLEHISEFPKTVGHGGAVFVEDPEAFPVLRHLLTAEGLEITHTDADLSQQLCDRCENKASEYDSGREEHLCRDCYDDACEQYWTDRYALS